MASTFEFELTSPDKIVLSKPVVMVAVPGPDGMYGILAGHAPMVTTLAAGIVEVYAKDEQTPSERLFVTGGYCEVTTSSCAILANDILPIASLDKKTLQSELAALQKRRDVCSEEEEIAETEASLAITSAKLMAVG